MRKKSQLGARSGRHGGAARRASNSPLPHTARRVCAEWMLFIAPRWQAFFPYFFFLKGIVSRILSSWQRSRCAKGESLLLLVVLRLATAGAVRTGRASFAFSIYPGFFFFFWQVNGVSRKVSFCVS